MRKPENIYKARGEQMGTTAGSLPLHSVFLPPGVLFGVTKPVIRITVAYLTSPWNYLWLTSSAGWLGIRAFDFLNQIKEVCFWKQSCRKSPVIRKKGDVFQAYRRSDMCVYNCIYIFFKYFFLSITASYTPRQQFPRYQSAILGENIIWSVTKNSRGKRPDDS